MSCPRFALVVVWWCACGWAVGVAQGPASTTRPKGEIDRLPIREVTAFKDGHAFVIRRGVVPTDGRGNVVLDELPEPVLGTFWPFASQAGPAKLVSVTAGQRRVAVTRTGLTLAALIEANVGSEAFITEAGGLRYPATIVGVPQRSSAELRATDPAGSRERAAEKANLVVLKTADGVKVVALDRIQDVTIKGDPKLTSPVEEFREVLTLKLAWSDGAPQPTADVGMGYLQEGFRWWPSYRVVITSDGQATVQLQATLVNDLADIEDGTVQLVIGVPSFEAKGMLDPISLQETLARVASRQDDASQLSNVLGNNAISSQIMVTAGEARGRRSGAAGDAAEPDATGEKQEDLFYFTVKNVTLMKGERLVTPVAEVKVPYKDVYRLDLTYAPPREMAPNVDISRQPLASRLLAAPKVQHALRLENQASFPLTTAPALILRDERVLAQGLITYTPPGGSVDLGLTAAVDVKVKKSDVEKARTIGAVQVKDARYSRVELTGTVELSSFARKPIEIEVTRWVLGEMKSATEGGKVEMVNVQEDGSWAESRPPWWGWYSWPYWWAQLNGVGRATWTVKLEPGKSSTLGYEWQYYWQ